MVCLIIDDAPVLSTSEWRLLVLPLLTFLVVKVVNRWVLHNLLLFILSQVLVERFESICRLHWELLVGCSVLLILVLLQLYYHRGLPIQLNNLAVSTHLSWRLQGITSLWVKIYLRQLKFSVVHWVFDRVKLIPQRHSLVRIVSLVQCVWGPNNAAWLFVHHRLRSINRGSHNRRWLHRVARGLLPPSLSLIYLRYEIVIGQVSLIQILLLRVHTPSRRRLYLYSVHNFVCLRRF